MRVVLLIFFFLTSLYGDTYNNSLLQIHAKVFPKLLLTDKNLNKKVFDNTIHLAIVYTKKDLKVAKKLRESMLTLYPHIKEYNFEIRLESYDDFEFKTNTTAYYLLNAPLEKIRAINEVADKQRVLTFSYQSAYLQLGTMMSLHVGKKLAPALNLEVIKKRHFIFDDILYKIAKIQ